MLVAYALMNMNASGTDSVKNFTTYYGRTVAHDIAVSGANIGCSDIFFDSTYSTPYTNVDFLNGKMNVTFSSAWGNRKYVRSIGSIDMGPVHIRDTVIAQLRNFSLARYAWLTNNEANKGGQTTTWSTGDTAWGPAHTNDKFNINGQPRFFKKATSVGNPVPANPPATIFQGGFQKGIYIPYPTNLDIFVSAALSPSGRAVIGRDAILTFNAAGTIRLQVPTVAYDSTFANATQFTANGAFVVQGGNLSVRGTVEGNLAIGAVTAPLLGGGNVFVTGDIIYKTDPRISPWSTDKLGIYATKDITVTYDNSAPLDYFNRKIDASIFSLTSEFKVQDAKLYPPRGTLNTYGAMMQYYRGVVGEVNPGSGTLKNGYNKGFHYDERLATNPPKYYPSMGRYLLYSWFEN